MKAKNTLLIAILTTAFFATAAFAHPIDQEQDQRLKPRVVGPQIKWTLEATKNFDPAWIHLKFAEGSGIQFQDQPNPAAADSFVDENGHALEQINLILGSAAEVARSFPGNPAYYKMLKAKGEATSGAVGPDLSLWFNIRITGDRQELVDTLNSLNELDFVEIAHPAPICDTAGLVDLQLLDPILFPLSVCAPPGGTPDFTANQGYLYDTPIGLDAPSAWGKGGGRGSEMKFIDVELGWTYNHEDFSSDLLFNQHPNDDPFYRNHGTAVVGEVCAMDNSYGVVGFASDTQWGTVGITVGEWPVVPQYFMEAAQSLDPGDVWLIELQMFPGGFDATPMEYLQVNFDAIWTSSFALDVICVEAGANGSQDLDAAAFNGLFDREVRDSGAILVGAGTPTGRVAEFFTNYGSRMDVHAWGSQIVTTGYGDLQNFGPESTQYTQTFGGTSGASPMIVGSALCLQGIKKRYTNSIYTPLEMRELLNSTGIDHLDSDQEIGPRPNIGAAVNAIFDDILLGDTNNDGLISLLDIAPFVEAINSGDFIGTADINCDGFVNLLDVAPFVDLLNN